MELISITSFDQLPHGVSQGLNLLLARVNELTELVKAAAPAIPVEEELLTREQTAKRLKISLPTLNELTKSGKVPAYRLGGRVRYKASEITQCAGLNRVIASRIAA